MQESARKQYCYKEFFFKRLINSQKELIYLKKKLINYKDMQHLIKLFVITIYVNIIRLISKKLINFLRNRNQQHNNKRNFDSNSSSKQK